ncbi:DUF3649 domain-containing protein [Stenotrophomonas sp. GD03908]|uniref:DUF3649 domain-containing protein n=1 Tax=Stenotrophomonas maltophilia TaxID=40324 RepID=A0AAJ2TGX9_STEMA|nr:MULTISPECIES: DUF3649 domain-containing protein [Stenotrophomonas]MBH1480942.1 DUF3649 domain-containing protein [Stenotrophomonas maltophilia]MCU1062553.1 DUF3649 domain-containing protein [Stenotrophomonas maltophilia]MDH0978144.1 DUF3649 domain-containing protein [Stenotrophomonas sp. GD03908]MDQ7294362.1 DUF3649 domain-containing protein [Stenotrophomonas sp. Sm0041]MDZ5763422.1 DUF3649 domain-containing protein [Stenotrophomonas maltophilia]
MTVSRTASVLAWLPLVSRIIAALFGGYVLAALCSIATLALPIDVRQAVFTGMLASFLLYAGAVVWVFAVRSAWRAWIGLIVIALPLWLVARAVGQGAGA